MSSILRALKKLEDDPRHLQETQPLDSTFVPLADTAPTRKWPGIIMVIIGGGVVCGLVLLAGLWLLLDKTPPEPMSSPAVSKQTVPPETQTAISESKDISEPAAEPVLRSTETAVPLSNEQQAPEPPPVVIAEPQAPVSAPEKIAPLAGDAPLQEIVEPDTGIAPEKSPESPVAEAVFATPPPPAAPLKPREPEIPVLRGSDVKLQAITWSKNPQKRIVVINNRILREGDTVQGFLIETINQDDIILVENGEKWKLLFGIK